MIKKDVLGALNHSIAKEKAATKQFVLIALKAKGKVAPVVHVDLSVVLNANYLLCYKTGDSACSDCTKDLATSFRRKLHGS